MDTRTRRTAKRAVPKFHESLSTRQFGRDLNAGGAVDDLKQPKATKTNHRVLDRGPIATARANEKVVEPGLGMDRPTTHGLGHVS